MGGVFDSAEEGHLEGVLVVAGGFGLPGGVFAEEWEEGFEESGVFEACEAGGGGGADEKVLVAEEGGEVFGGLFFGAVGEGVGEPAAFTDGAAVGGSDDGGEGFGIGVATECGDGGGAEEVGIGGEDLEGAFLGGDGVVGPGVVEDGGELGGVVGFPGLLEAGGEVGGGAGLGLGERGGGEGEEEGEEKGAEGGQEGGGCHGGMVPPVKTCEWGRRRGLARERGWPMSLLRREVLWVWLLLRRVIRW